MISEINETYPNNMITTTQYLLGFIMEDFLLDEFLFKILQETFRTVCPSSALSGSFFGVKNHLLCYLQFKP